ncbi:MULTISPECIES: hypothetical protein [Aquimarina]|uniref:Uncharacterized protein n=1 Tax=Aquimarina algiphila TaxID=2047982 RepID=A0A554VJS2_9FLAO|nr:MULTISPECIES: hypothetical protein [Aquimarina]TSE08156.1 hypothetical protein FOF46_13200 [Aquimarina algiphila]
MSKILTSFILFITTSITFGQQANPAVFFTQRDQINKFHTISDLQSLKKGELINLYQDRVKEIMTILPFLSLTNEAGVRLGDIGIKEDSRHLKVLKNTTESIRDNLETIDTMVEELIPYADTEKIISTILYYEEIIKKIRIGVDGNF